MILFTFCCEYWSFEEGTVLMSFMKYKATIESTEPRRAVPVNMGIKSSLTVQIGYIYV